MSTPTPNPEYNYNAAFFKITALSNIHAGSGSEGYGIIDNLVQRDPTTGFPCIFASSLKGALRELFKNLLIEDEEEKEKLITYIFGSKKKEAEIEEDKSDETASEEEESEEDKVDKKIKASQAGKYRFLQADLLSIPVRSDVLPYFNATCHCILESVQSQLNLFNMKYPQDWLSPMLNLSLVDGNDAIHFEERYGDVALDVEELKAKKNSKTDNYSAMQKILGDNPVLINNEYFTEVVGDFHLPVIARNYLEDGRSSNLWYEQVLPRETRLVFAVLYPGDDSINYFDTFKNTIESYTVQIGANASVGYGFCKIEEIELEHEMVMP